MGKKFCAGSAIIAAALILGGCAGGGADPSGAEASPAESFHAETDGSSGEAEAVGNENSYDSGSSGNNLVLLETLIMEASDKPDSYSVRIAWNGYGDLDGDGKNELLAVYGSDEDNAVDVTASSVFSVYGELWFADDEGAVRLYTESEWWVSNFDPVIRIDDEWLIHIDQVNDPGFISFCYRMKNGRPERIETYRLGALAYAGDRDFVGCSLAYDSGRDDMPTAKPYWFYLPEGSDRLFEYKGTEITMEEFSGYEGSEEAIDKISMDKGEIINIFYRENGIINVNYKTDAFGGILYLYRNLQVTENGSLEDFTPERNYGRYISSVSGSYFLDYVIY